MSPCATCGHTRSEHSVGKPAHCLVSSPRAYARNLCTCREFVEASTFIRNEDINADDCRECGATWQRCLQGGWGDDRDDGPHPEDVCCRTCHETDTHQAEKARHQLRDPAAGVVERVRRDVGTLERMLEIADQQRMDFKRHADGAIAERDAFKARVEDLESAQETRAVALRQANTRARELEADTARYRVMHAAQVETIEQLRTQIEAGGGDLSGVAIEALLEEIKRRATR